MDGKRTRRWIWLPVIGVAAVLAFVIVSPAGNHVDLMAHATRVPGYSPIGGVIAAECRWRSPTTVEVVDGTNNISTVDVRTGTCVTASGKPGDRSASDWRFNYAISRKGIVSGLTFTKKDGTQSFQIPTRGYASIAWRGNSCVMVELDAKQQPVEYVRVDPGKRSVIRTGIRPSGREFIQGFLGPDSILTSAVTFQRTFSVLNLTTGKRVEIAPAFPRDGFVYEVHVAPDDQKLMWYLGVGQQRLTVFHRLLAKLGMMRSIPNPPPYETEGIWISRADGSELKELGQVPCEWAPAGFYMPRWLPDSRRISFLYRNGMYIVPAE